MSDSAHERDRARFQSEGRTRGQEHRARLDDAVGDGPVSIAVGQMGGEFGLPQRAALGVPLRQRNVDRTFSFADDHAAEAVVVRFGRRQARDAQVPV